MKPLYCLLVICFLSLPVVSLFGQDKSKGSSFDFFAKGENSYTLKDNAYYGHMKYIVNGQNYSRSNRTYFDLEWNHWFGKGLGAGLNIDANWTGTHYYSGNTDQLFRGWTISPNIAYGKTLSDRLGVYARAEITWGKNKDISKGQPINTTNKSDLFGYSGSIGVPYRFSNYTALTAELSYDHLRTKFGSASKEDENSFGVNLHLEDYMPCSRIRCDHSTGFKLSKDKFKQGSGFINYDSEIGFFSGNNTQTYSNPSYTFKNKFSNTNVDLNGSFYVKDNVALGGGLDFGHMVQKSDDNTFHYTWNYFNFDPEVIINAPVNNGWRNVFVKGGGYFGSNKTTISSITTNSTGKNNITGYNFGAGYFGFFSEQTAVQTCVYYRSTTTRYKDTDDKAINRGIAVSVGLVHSFR
jgi:hypothetical protein